MQKYITNSVVVVAALYVVFAGLLVVAAVLDTTSWVEVKDWLVKGAAVACVVLAINIVITFLTQLIPHSEDLPKKK